QRVIAVRGLQRSIVEPTDEEFARNNQTVRTATRGEIAAEIPNAVRCRLRAAVVESDDLSFPFDPSKEDHGVTGLFRPKLDEVSWLRIEGVDFLTEMQIFHRLHKRLNLRTAGHPVPLFLKSLEVRSSQAVQKSTLSSCFHRNRKGKSAAVRSRPGGQDFD